MTNGAAKSTDDGLKLTNGAVKTTNGSLKFTNETLEITNKWLNLTSNVANLTNDGKISSNSPVLANLSLFYLAADDALTLLRIHSRTLYDARAACKMVCEASKENSISFSQQLTSE